jgi:NAD-dependent SIR2 family protein deacetylase
MNAPLDAALVHQAALQIAAADALVIGAGAGMGVDSGLPDFRGDQGFWRAYPAYEKLGLSFSNMANPRWFRTDPEMAWGFYGHRLELYRKTRPHAGFGILLSWAGRMKHGALVFTSNVDGQFQRAGFDPARIVEAHGAIDFLQCTRASCEGIFPADPYQVTVDEATFRARPPLPACPRCGALARPNILMFGDGEWDPRRTEQQEARLAGLLRVVEPGKVAVVECGAGSAIPTVRHFCERLARSTKARLIRINPREPEAPAEGLGFASGAAATLAAIDEALGRITGARA